MKAGLLEPFWRREKTMNVVPGAVSAPMGVPMQMQAPNRAYTVKPAEETEPKAITSEQIQAMLDENSNLIVEIITLNNQIKQAKGTGQQGDVMEKLDKKRKKLNKNLMTLAKWADESSDQPPRPPPTAYYAPPQGQYAPRGMAMNPMAPQMAMAHPQMQMAPRYNQAQMQAMAQAQYRAHMSTMGGHTGYGNVATAQTRYHDPAAMGYSGMAPVMRPMPMGMPTGYGGTAPMGYPMATPHGYGMVAPQQVMSRMGGASDGNSSNATGVLNPEAT